MQAARSAVLIALLCGAVFSAQAQWQWLDKDGHKVFSDRAPPPDVPERNILKQPGGGKPANAGLAAAAAVPAAVAAPAAAAPKPPVPRLAGKDSELDARKKAADDAEAQRKKAEEDKLAAARADNCQRARQSQAMLDSGVRMTQMNAQGERIFLDDAQRAAESQRVQAIVASDCR